VLNGGSKRTRAFEDLGQWRENGADGRGVEGAQSHGRTLGQQLARQQGGAEGSGHCEKERECVCVTKRVNGIQDNDIRALDQHSRKVWSCSLLALAALLLALSSFYQGKRGTKWKARSKVEREGARLEYSHCQTQIFQRCTSRLGTADLGRLVPEKREANDHHDVYDSSSSNSDQLLAPSPTPSCRPQWPRQWLPAGSH
jgi:hypothetical protein